MEITPSLTFPDNLHLAANLSSYWPYSTTKWMWTLAPPILIAFGTFGNIMTLVVLQSLTRSTTNLFLQALAIADLLLLYFGLLTEWLDVAFGFSFKNAHTITCKLGNFMWNSLGVLSAWLIVVITVHRAVCVCWPYSVDTLYVSRRPMLFILGTTVVSFALNSHMLYGIGLKMSQNGSAVECFAMESDVYLAFFTTVWPWIDLLVFSLLPFVVLVISNSVLLKKLMLFTQNSSHCRLSHNRQKVLSSVTMTLIVVSIMFLILTLPVSILILLWINCIYPRYYSDMEVRAFAMLLYCLSNLLWYSNSAINFCIYCLTGTQFKTKLKTMLHLPQRNMLSKEEDKNIKLKQLKQSPNDEELKCTNSLIMDSCN